MPPTLNPIIAELFRYCRDEAVFKTWNRRSPQGKSEELNKAIGSAVQANKLSRNVAELDDAIKDAVVNYVASSFYVAGLAVRETPFPGFTVSHVAGVAISELTDAEGMPVREQIVALGKEPPKGSGPTR